MSPPETIGAGGASDRAIYYAPEVAFDRPVPRVPPAVFAAERDRAFDPAAPTGWVPLDQSEALGCAWPATTPALLAGYIVIRAGERFAHTVKSTGQVYYVIRGDGMTTCRQERFSWDQGDGFCLPGGTEIELTSASGAILLMVSNEPELSFLRANSDGQAADDLTPTCFRATEVDARLRQVHGRNGEQKSAGKSVVFVTPLMEARRLTTPTLLAAINSLEAGGDQRPHRHSSAALTLSIAGEGVHSLVDGQVIPWRPDTVIVTPAYAVHSHHNRGAREMRSFVVQDTGLYTELRSLSFAWTDAAPSPSET